MMRRVAVILNARAGSAQKRDLQEEIVDSFRKWEVEARVFPASTTALLHKAVRCLRDEKVDAVVAGGGDGTVSTVASYLVGGETPLGILPLGTLNHFARDLGVPLDLEEAIHLICSAAARKVDIGSVNGLFFVNNSSLGLYPDQVRIRQKWRPRVGKWLAMLTGSVIALVRFPLLRVRLYVGDKRLKRRCPLILVSNNEYKFEPGRLPTREQTGGGRLGIYLLRDEGRTGLIRLALHSLVYRPEEATSFENFSAPAATILINKRVVRVALDGEIHKIRAPLRFASVPGGLRVIAPPGPRRESPTSAKL